MEVWNALTPYCDALRQGIEDNNWYLSLMAALILPEICVTLEKGRSGRTAYVEWFDKFVKAYNHKLHSSRALESVTTLSEYTKVIESGVTRKKEDLKIIDLQYFSGVNAYALRCSFLHNGDGNVGEQDIMNDEKFGKDALDIKHVKFDIVPTNRVVSKFGDTVRLNPRNYCEAILEAVEMWILENEMDDQTIDNAKKLNIFS